VATFQRSGYSLTSIRAFDVFPMTQHVECVAVLRPTDAG
jgi:tRNA/tmRNA/rRNA uracil-C5-methylase (TrmA/RlmC/RlmD family)